MNARKKGLSYVHEVKKLLLAMSHQVEGPGFKPAFFGGKLSVVHSDFFDCFDLISFDGKEYFGHQVSTLSNKSAKVKAIKAKNMPGWVWARTDKPVGYRIFQVDRKGKVTEAKAIYGIRGEIKK